MALVLSFFVTAASFSYAQPPVRISVDVIVGTRAPAGNEVRLMRTEEEKHPNITKSMHDIEDAMKHLHDAPDDFGGHKAQAEADLKQSWISLRKALYFQIYKEGR